MLICPICHTDLNLQGKTYTCQHRHSYDIGKDGYVNLQLMQECYPKVEFRATREH